MRGETRGAAFETALGWMAVAASADGLTRVVLPQAAEADALRELGDVPVAGDSFFADLKARFRAYCAGERVDFPDRLDLAPYTDFQRAVWRAARRIPRGETRSYAWVAAGAGNPGAARAAGGALGRNPLPIIIPCHRVVAADGSLGGFGGGLDLKRRLLAVEQGIYTR